MNQRAHVRPVRIVTWNVHGSAQPNPQALADMLKTFEPDVLCLQEIRYEQAHHLSHELGMAHPFWMVKHNPYIGRPKMAEGLAIVATQEIDHGNWVVLSKRTPMFSHKRRIMQWATLPAHDNMPEVTVINTHLSTELDDAAHQCEVLIAAAPATSVLAGDLNHAFGSTTLNALAASGWRDLAPTPPPTRVDFVLVPQRWDASSIECRVDTSEIEKCSDHTPVGVEVWPLGEPE